MAVSSEPIFPAHDAFTSFTRRDAANILFKYKWMILTMFFVTTFVAASCLYLLPPTFISEAKVLIKTEQQGKPSFLAGIASYQESDLTDPSNRKLETEMELIVSRSLVEETIRALGIKYSDIYHKPYVLLANALTPVFDAIQRFFGFKSPKEKGMGTLTREFMKSMSVSPVMSKSSDTKSNIIEIKLKATNPLIASHALNYLLHAYAAFDARLDQKTGQDVLVILQKEINQSLLDLKEKQRNLQRFLTRTGWRPVQGDASSLPESIPSSGLEQAGTGNDGGLAKPPAPDRLSNLIVPAQAIQGSSLSFMKRQLAWMKVRLAEWQGKYTGNSPRLQVLEASISELKKKIKHESKEFAAREIKGRALERDYRLVNERYMRLKKKYNQIILYLKLSPIQSETRVMINPASVPEQSEWKKSAIIGILSSVLGLMFGIGFAGYREYSDHRLTTATDIENHLGFNLLATIPVIDPESDIHTVLSPRE